MLNTLRKDVVKSVKTKNDNSTGAIVDRFASVRVLVVGDVLLDRFQYGKIERIAGFLAIEHLHRRNNMLKLSFSIRHSFIGIRS